MKKVCNVCRRKRDAKKFALKREIKNLKRLNNLSLQFLFTESCPSCGVKIRKRKS